MFYKKLYLHFCSKIVKVFWICNANCDLSVNSKIDLYYISFPNKKYGLH